jgi:hypothetical protein
MRRSPPTIAEIAAALEAAWSSALPGRETCERDAPAAVPKGPGQCPRGSMQSGAYCLEMRRR